MTIKTELVKERLPGLVELFIINLTSVDGGIHYLSPTVIEEGNSIVFGGQSYIPFPIQGQGWAAGTDGSPARPTLLVSNITKYLQSDINLYKDFVGAAVTRVLTFDKYLDAASFTRRNRLDWSSKYNEGATWIKTQCTADEMTYKGPYDTAAWKITDTSTSAASLLQHTGRNYGWGPGDSFTASGYFCVCPDTTTPGFHMNVVMPGREAHAYFQIDTTGSEPKLIGSTSDPAFVSNVQSDLVDVDGNRYWFRCSFTTSMLTAGDVQWRVWVNDRGIHSRLGSLVVAGAQLELGTHPSKYQYTTTTHQPFADANQVFRSQLYKVIQKSKQNKYEIEFTLADPLDLPTMKLPRRQVTTTMFPAAGKVRRT